MRQLSDGSIAFRESRLSILRGFPLCSVGSSSLSVVCKLGYDFRNYDWFLALCIDFNIHGHINVIVVLVYVEDRFVQLFSVCYSILLNFTY